VSVHARKKGGQGSPEAADFDGMASTTLFNVDGGKVGLQQARWVLRDEVLMGSSRRLARIRLIGQVGRRSDKASSHRSSRRTAMAERRRLIFWWTIRASPADLDRGFFILFSSFIFQYAPIDSLSSILIEDPS
jgi:hypothetical protein